MRINPSLFIWRRYIQFIIFIAILALPLAHVNGFTQVRGNFFAWNIFGLPIADPLVAMQSILQGLVHGFWPRLELICGALVSLLLALFLGRIFCSWICPYGFLSELFWAIRKKAKPKFVISGWRWRIALSITVLILGVILALPAINHVSLPGIISLIPIQAWGQGAVHSMGIAFMVTFTYILPVVALLCAELFLGQRLWCQSLCPQALLLMLMTKLRAKLPVFLGPHMRLHFTPSKCTCKGQNPCAKVCSLQLNARHKHFAHSLCTNCGECVGACSKQGGALNICLK